MNRTKLEKKFLQQTTKFAIDLAVKSGNILIRYQSRLGSLKISRKVAQGVVSQADFMSETFLIKEINKKYPSHQILAEESAYNNYTSKASQIKKLQGHEFCWVMDPLDGTSNYLNGNDYYAVCISLLHFGKPVVGVVYRPRNGDCFVATINEGAYFYNLKQKSKKVRLSFPKKNKKMRDSLLVTGFAGEKDAKNFNQEFKLFKNIMKTSRGVRRLGSAALDLCYVANGVWDGFWEKGLAPWDVAAAGLICQEAGVKVSDYKKVAFNPFQTSIVAARAPLYDEFINLF